jgi:hypothetical protein
MAARKVGVPFDFQKLEIQNAVIQNLGAAPGTPVEGQIYHDTVAHAPYYRNNSAWVSMNPASLLGLANTWTSTNVFNGAVTGNNTINLTGVGGSSVGGVFSATQHTATGQTGAAVSTKYAGGTASGAPASGTFSTGDWIVTTGGDVWINTSGGTPGTWARVGNWVFGNNNTWSGTNAFNAAVSGSGSITMSNTVSGTALIATGLTGATAASRYVGSTASGSPATGTFVTGDWIVSQNGVMWVCTTGGTPGTWASAGGTVYNQSIKANNAAAVTQRAVINFVNGTYTTATATDVSSQTDVKFDVTTGTPVAVAFGGTNSNGSGTALALANHQHQGPTHDASAHNAIPISALSAATAAVAMGGFKITGIGDGTAATDAASWGQVQGLIQGLEWKASVRTISLTQAAIATAYANGQTLNGVTLATGDRILLAGQTAAAENGIYIVAASGAPTRATDADASGELSVGAVVPIESGTGVANTFYYCTATGANPWVPGTSTSTWAFMFQITATQAGAGLTQSSNILAVGAGTGIVVNADDVAVNRTGTNNAHVPLLFTTATHASATSIAITHNLGQQFVLAQVYEVATLSQVEVDVVCTSTSVTTFNFATAPTANTYRFLIYG